MATAKQIKWDNSENVAVKYAFYYGTDGQGNDLSIASLKITNVSQLLNDSGYITSSALSGYATESWVGNNYVSISGTGSRFIQSTGTDTPLIVQGFSNDTYLEFRNANGTTIGYYSVKGDNKPYFYMNGAKKIMIATDFQYDATTGVLNIVTT